MFEDEISFHLIPHGFLPCAYIFAKLSIQKIYALDQ